jgi:hypothetical protein
VLYIVDVGVGRKLLVRVVVAHLRVSPGHGVN